MRTFQTDTENNDIILLGRGYGLAAGFAVCEGRKAVATVLEAIVRAVRGELVLHAKRGLPHLSTVFKGAVRLDDWEYDLRTAVQNCAYVREIKTLETELDRKAGVLSYRLVVSTDYGDEEISDTFAEQDFAVTDDMTGGMPRNGRPIYRTRKTYTSGLTQLKLTFSVPSSVFAVQVKALPNATCSVFWGDGSSDTADTTDAFETLTHTYRTPGDYALSLSIEAAGFRVGATADDTASKTAVTEIVGFGTSLQDLSYALQGCVNVTGAIPPWPFDLKNAAHCYDGCHGLSSVWSDEEKSLQPAGAEEYEGCVTGCSPAVRSKFDVSWGGIRDRLFPFSLRGTVGSIVDAHNEIVRIVPLDAETREMSVDKPLDQNVTLFGEVLLDLFRRDFITGDVVKALVPDRWDDTPKTILTKINNLYNAMIKERK